jgi:23S rRNA A2030 N6-methylase RlmJ
MAHRHYGKLSEVWKHLILAELLHRHGSRRFWETHAGSAVYPLTHDPYRDHGVFWFLDHSASKRGLDESAYKKLLQGLPQKDGYPVYYPGSPMVAMLEIGEKAQEFIFCDIANESIEDLRRQAHALGLAGVTRCVQDDGVTAIWNAAQTATRSSEIVIHIDPFDPFEASGPRGLSPLDLCRRLAERGFRTVYWYGYGKSDEQAFAWQELAPGLSGTVKTLWCGDLILASEAGRSGNSTHHMDPIVGSGVVLANFPMEDLERCYQDAPLLQGSGALLFTSMRL